MAEKPKIGIIGKGNVGSHLGDGLKKAGYEVEICGSDQKNVEQTARNNDMLILAVPPDQTRNVIDEFNGQHKGKILVDVTNVVDENGEFAGSMDQSKAEEVQSIARDATVVKAFNTVFADNMDTGQANGDRLSLFVAGDDEKSRMLVEQLGKDIGFDPVDAGPLKNARYLEALGYLNMQLGMKQGMGSEIGFRLIHE